MPLKMIHHHDEILTLREPLSCSLLTTNQDFTNEGEAHDPLDQTLPYGSKLTDFPVGSKGDQILSYITDVQDNSQVRKGGPSQNRGQMGIEQTSGFPSTYSAFSLPICLVFEFLVTDKASHRDDSRKLRFGRGLDGLTRLASPSDTLFFSFSPSLYVYTSSRQLSSHPGKESRWRKLLLDRSECSLKRSRSKLPWSRRSLDDSSSS